jgi:phosphate transport system substrate-binding protein
MASRPLAPDEDDLTAHPIAADGVALIVHETNPIDALTNRQTVGIYTGQIDSWEQVGGRDEEITVVHKAEGRATLEVFLKHFGIENPSVSADVIVGENEHAVKTVAGTKNAVGYVSIGTAEANIESGVPLRLLPLEGVEASAANVASGAFPMSRPLNLVTTDSPSPLASEFIRFCQSKGVHDLVTSLYFVPLESGADVAK